jgi:PPOX class probable F420-dependent enzyme
MLSSRARAFLEAANYATLATLDPDGSPRTAVIWYLLEDNGAILVNSAVGRRWPANLRREPRVSLAVIDRVDGLKWLGLSGRVERIDDDQAIAQADIAGLARRYHVEDPWEAERIIVERFTRQHRVSFRIRPTAVHDHLD